MLTWFVFVCFGCLCFGLSCDLLCVSWVCALMLCGFLQCCTLDACDFTCFLFVLLFLCASCSLICCLHCLCFAFLVCVCLLYWFAVDCDTWDDGLDLVLRRLVFVFDFVLVWFCLCLYFGLVFCFVLSLLGLL